MSSQDALNAELARVFAGADTEMLALRQRFEETAAGWPVSLRAACLKKIPVLSRLTQRSAPVDFQIARARVAAGLFLVATADGRYDADPKAKAELEGLAAGWIRTSAATEEMRTELLNWMANRSDLVNVDVTLPRDAGGAKAAGDVYAARRQNIRSVT